MNTDEPAKTLIVVNYLSQDPQKGLTDINQTRDDIATPSTQAEPSDDDSMNGEFFNIPRGCIFNQIPPDSPTAVTDFPACSNHPMAVQLTETLQITV